MGRRGKRAQYKNGNSDYEYSDEENEEIVTEFVPCWSSMVQDADDKILDLLLEYEEIDSRFNWLGLYEITNCIEEIVTEDVNYYYSEFTDFKVETIIYDFINIVFDIVDIEKVPIIDSYKYIESTEEECIDPKEGIVYPVQNKNKAILYMNRCIKKVFNKYFITPLPYRSDRNPLYYEDDDDCYITQDDYIYAY